MAASNDTMTGVESDMDEQTVAGTATQLPFSFANRHCVLLSVAAEEETPE